MAYRFNAEYLAGTGYDKSTDSLEAVSNAVAAIGTDDTVRHIPKFGGDLWYVDGVNGDNGNDGKSPDASFATITYGHSQMAAGDALNIRAATYAEDVTITGKNSVELWFEIGAIITGQSNDYALDIAASYVKIKCTGASVRVNPAAGKSGVRVSGNWVYFNDIRVSCGSSGLIGFDVTGDGCVGTNCRTSTPLTAAFKIQGDKVKLDDCCTGGNAGDSSIGFWVTNNADKTRLKNCGSQGHETAGYQIDSGVTNGAAEECYSGGGDGPKSDPTHVFTWPDFQIDHEVTKTITFSDVGTTHNIFKVTGMVKIYDIYGAVETQIENIASTIYLEAFSAGGSSDITDSPGVDIQNAAVGAILIRNEDATGNLVLTDPTAPTVTESTSFRDPKNPVTVTAHPGTDTYIRDHVSAQLASGEIHWHCHYEPLTDGAFLEAA